MVILQLKKIIVNSSSTTPSSGTCNNSNSVSSPSSLRESSSSKAHCYESSSPCKSPFLESFSSTSMISSNELFKERLDLKKKKQLSLNSYHHALNSPTLTPTTPTTPHSPSHLAHSPSRVGKQPRSRMQTTGIQANLKEKVIEEIPSVFDVCFATKADSKSEHSHHSNNGNILESDELKRLQDTLLAEYCKLRPVTVQVDREQRTDKTTVCSMKQLISVTLHLPHLNRKKMN